jgi:hypothetical protein
MKSLLIQAPANVRIQTFDGPLRRDGVDKPTGL